MSGCGSLGELGRYQSPARPRLPQPQTTGRGALPLHEPAERRDANAVRGEGPPAGRAARPSRQWFSWYPRSVLRISGWRAVPMSLGSSLTGSTTSRVSVLVVRGAAAGRCGTILSHGRGWQRARQGCTGGSGVDATTTCCDRRRADVLLEGYRRQLQGAVVALEAMARCGQADAVGSRSSVS